MFRLLPLFVFPLLFSFNFSPMSQSIELGFDRKGTQFLIENDGASNIAVELTVKKRIMDENGNETLEDTSDISVFPPQVIIPPGEKRTIRTNYNNKDKPGQELNYRLIAEQLPLKVDAKTKDQTGIKMLMKYVAALYVSPEGGKPEIKLAAHSSDGETMSITVENSGIRHQLLNNPEIKWIHQGKKDQLKSGELIGVAGENVLAGHKRVFKFKTKKSIPKDAKVELQIHD